MSAVELMVEQQTNQGIGKNILVVEDEPDIAAVIRLTFEREGFVTEWCTNGEDALQRIDHDGIDLVVLDVILPGIDGHDVCRRIRTSESTETLPVIMLTSLTEETDMVVGLGMGADDYVKKPFSAPELVARTQAALRRVGMGANEEDTGKICVGS